MREKKYVIPLKPIAWARAGVSFKDKRFYDKQTTQKSYYGIYLEQQHGNDPFFKAPAIEAYFYFKDTKQAKSKPTYPLHLSVPDLDNLLKFTLDCLKGILVEDDCIFPTVMAHKRYGPQEKIEIVITELWKEKE